MPRDVPTTSEPLVTAEARRAQGSNEAHAANVAADEFRPWLLAGTVALFVARPLLTSEGAIAGGDALLFVVLPLVIAAAWSLRACTRSASAARYGLFDLLLIAYVAWNAVSAAVAMRYGAPRPAVNAVWQTVSLALLVFLVRQLVVRPREVRAIAAVMIAAAVAQSAFGFHQVFYSMPRDRAAYLADEDAALRAAGVYAPPGSRQRELFKNRVMSKEPIGTFALANSLAGFLAVWLTVALGIVAAAVVVRTRNPWLWLPALAVAMLITACLILTKSRAAVLASFCGAGALVAWMLLRGARLSRVAVGIAAAVTVLVAVLVAGAAAAGLLDRQVLTEAGKSLGYRLQYWESTGAMIREHSLFGCGPGQFQNNYTRYKLPEASEAVADPHNFLLEAWATAGTPVAALLVGMICLVAWRVGRADPSPEEPQASDAHASEGAGSGKTRSSSRRGDGKRLSHHASASALPRDATRYILAAGIAGYVLAYLAGALAIVPLSLAACGGGMLTSAITITALYPWVRRGRLPVFVLAIAAAVLLVNLSAAGGFTFAGVAGTLWLLAALCLASVEPWRRLPTIAAGSVFACIAVLVVCFYLTSYRPVMGSNLELDRADAEPERAELHLSNAAIADPLSAEPLRRMAMLEWMKWKTSATESSFNRFMTAINGALALDPKSAALFEFKGDVCYEVYQRTHKADVIASATASYRRATELHPTAIAAHAKLALALSAAGEHEQAAAEAAEALRLHELTPHEDQKLPSEMLDRLRLLVGR